MLYFEEKKIYLVVTAEIYFWGKYMQSKGVFGGILYITWNPLMEYVRTT